MRILDLYIGKILFRHIMVTIVVLLGLFVFVTFIDELGDLDRGGYGIVQVIQYVLLGVPKILYEIFPMAALIGSIMGLSVLARDSELIVMRASGVSVQRIVFSVLKVGILLALIAMVMGEIVSPYTETRAQRLRAEAIQNNIDQEDFGIWLRDDNTYVNVGEVLPDLTLLRVKIFEFDSQGALRFLSTAQKGTHDKKRWLLSGLQRTMIRDTSSAADTVTAAYWSTVVNPDILKVFRVQPDQLSIWVPFVFKEARSGSLGRSLFSGIMIGLGFFILNKAFVYFVPLFNIIPIIGAIVPTLLVCAMAMLMIRRIV